MPRSLRSFSAVVWCGCALLFGVAFPVCADCPVTLTVQPPDANGNVVATATSTGECGGSNVGIALDGNTLATKDCASGVNYGPQCSLTTTFSARCLASASHTVTAWGGCQHQGTTILPNGQHTCEWDPNGGSTASSFTADATPVVHLAYSGPDEMGHGSVTITWQFKYNGYGHVQFIVDGTVRNENWYPSTPAGTWTFPYDFTCGAPGAPTLIARALACGGVGPTTYPSEPSLIADDQKTITLADTTTVANNYDEDTDILTLTTHFPNTDSSLSRHITIYIDGQQAAGNFNDCISGVDGSCSNRLNLSCGATHHVEVSVNGCSRSEPMYNDSTSFDAAPVCPPDPNGCAPALSTSNTAGAGSITFGGAGASCPTNLCVHIPVHVGTGDVSVEIPLFTISQSPMPLPFALHYHSTPPSFPAAVKYPMGTGWTHPYNMSIVPVGAGRLLLYTATGDRMYFDPQSSTVWTAARPAYLGDYVTLTSGNYILHYPDGGSSTFSSITGNWLSTQDRWDNEMSGTYDAGGHLATVTDGEGRVITLEYASGLLARVVLSDGSAWSFDYTAAPNGTFLTAIHDPVNATPSWRTFAYRLQSDGTYHGLTEVRDAAGKLVEGHAYDGLDRGITSFREAGRDLYQFAYDTPSVGQTRVTRTIAGQTVQVTDYTIVRKNGAYVPTQVTGVCPDCGSSTDSKAMTYDATGRVLSITDASGHTTRFTYDAIGNPLSRTEAAGTMERISTFEYGYPSWPNFVTRVTQPSATGTGVKTTDYAWSAGETVLTVTETGKLSADPASQVAYSRATTYDARHRVISEDGPRSDVADVTTRMYYSDVETDVSKRGRLQQVVNPIGLTTTYSNYDLFGTAGSVTDANGVTTNVQTDARGRVTSSTNTAVPGDANETTDYVSTSTY